MSTDDKFVVTGRDQLRAQLIIQEGSYWRDHPDEFTKDEFNFIVKRRGFNLDEVRELARLCDWFGLKFAV